MTAQRDDPRAWDDIELLSAIAQRDGQAFSVFYRRHLSAALAYLMRETGDPEIAADLVAEVFAAVLLSAARYEAQGNTALPWVIGIARNKLLMSRRRGRVEAKARRKLALEPAELCDTDVERIERLAGAGLGRLEQLVSALPQDERFAVRSRILDERSYREIADELQCSEMVIRKRVSRGLSRVRDQMTETRSR